MELPSYCFCILTYLTCSPTFGNAGFFGNNNNDNIDDAVTSTPFPASYRSYLASFPGFNTSHFGASTFSDAAVYASETWRGWSITIERHKNSIWHYLLSIPRYSLNFYDSVKRGKGMKLPNYFQNGEKKYPIDT